MDPLCPERQARYFMPNFAAWLGSGSAGMRPSDQVAERAAAAWSRIQDKPISVSFRRNGATIAAQTFRLEMQSTQDVNRRSTTLNDAPRPLGTLFGVKDHPDNSVADSDVQVGDRFLYEGGEFDVIAVYPYPGEVQAQVQRR